SVGGGLPALRCVYIPRLFGGKHRSSPAPELEPASKREGLAFSRRLEVLIEDREPGVVLSLNAQPQAPVRRAVLEDEVGDVEGHPLGGLLPEAAMAGHRRGERTLEHEAGGERMRVVREP